MATKNTDPTPTPAKREAELRADAESVRAKAADLRGAMARHRPKVRDLATRLERLRSGNPDQFTLGGSAGTCVPA